MQSCRVDGMASIERDKICYWKADGTWLIFIPDCGIGCLRNHTVTEHEDGTISVVPSILTNGHNEGVPTQAHGYLTHGEWRAC
jgi:hypothetical protein